MPNSSNHMQFWLALLAYRVDTEQRSRIWNGYLAWKLPGSLFHKIHNVGKPPFNRFALGLPLQLTEEEKNSLDALADSYGGHPLSPDTISTIPTPYMDFSAHSFDVDVCFSGRIPPCVREVVRCSTFLYFSGGRDRTLTWDTHRNADLRC